MSTFVGIDPGLSGAIAVIREGRCVVFDVKIEPSGSAARRVKNRVSAYHTFSALEGELLGIDDAECALESVASRPGEGVASAFSFGDTFGSLRAVADLLCYNVTYPVPWKWKSDLGFEAGADKDASREMAVRLYPECANMLKRKKDHDRAEAILLAHWCKLLKTGELNHD